MTIIEGVMGIISTIITEKTNDQLQIRFNFSGVFVKDTRCNLSDMEVGPSSTDFCGFVKVHDTLPSTLMYSELFTWDGDEYMINCDLNSESIREFANKIVDRLNDLGYLTNSSEKIADNNII